MNLFLLDVLLGERVLSHRVCMSSALIGAAQQLFPAVAPGDTLVGQFGLFHTLTTVGTLCFGHYGECVMVSLL